MPTEVFVLFVVLVDVAVGVYLSHRAGEKANARWERILDSEREDRQDLLNRLMAQDYTQYVAVSNVPQEPLPVIERVWDPTGLIEIDASDDQTLIP